MHYARCPDCLTTLQITEQQLSLKAGLVRCGHCQQVFDAHDNKITPVSNPARILDSRSNDPRPPERIEPNLKDTAFNTPEPALSPAAWETPQTSFTRSVPYGLLCFLSSLLLLAQLMYHQAATFTQSPSLQPVLKQINTTFNLDIPRYKNLDEIHVLYRDLSPHPYLKDTLKLQLTIKNFAPVEQDFPIIHVSLSSITGEKIAYGQFSKSNYLLKNDVHTLFKANELKQINLLFKNTRRKAVGFEISFSG